MEGIVLAEKRKKTIKTDSVLADFVAKIPNEVRRFSNLKSLIAHEITKAIEAKGVTQKEFAEHIGIKPSRLSKILQGEQNLTLKSIAEIETAIDLQIFFTRAFPEGATEIFETDPGMPRELVVINTGTENTISFAENVEELNNYGYGSKRESEEPEKLIYSFPGNFE